MSDPCISLGTKSWRECRDGLVHRPRFLGKDTEAQREGGLLPVLLTGSDAVVKVLSVLVWHKHSSSGLGGEFEWKAVWCSVMSNSL